MYQWRRQFDEQVITQRSTLAGLKSGKSYSKWQKSIILNQLQRSGAKPHQLQNLTNHPKLVVYYRWASSIMLRKRLTCWRDWILIQSTGKEKEALALEYFSRSSLATNQGKTPNWTWLEPSSLKSWKRAGDKSRPSDVSLSPTPFTVCKVINAS